MEGILKMQSGSPLCPAIGPGVSRYPGTTQGFGVLPEGINMIPNKQMDQNGDYTKITKPRSILHSFTY